MKGEDERLSSAKALLPQAPVLKLHGAKLVALFIFTDQERVALVLNLLAKCDSGAAVLGHPVQQLPVTPAIGRIHVLSEVRELVVAQNL